MMALVRCPQCGRVADGIACFACGYEWGDDSISTHIDDASEEPAIAADVQIPETPPSEESAPIFIEEPIPSRTLTPAPMAAPVTPPVVGTEIPAAAPDPVQTSEGGSPSGVTEDLSEILSGLDLPVVSPASDSLEFDLDDIMDPALEPADAASPVAAPTPPPPANDPLSIAFSMDGLDLDGDGDKASPSPAPPPQLPEGFEDEFGGIPGTPIPSDLDVLEGELGDLDSLSEEDELGDLDDFGDLGDDLGLGDVVLDTNELKAEDLLAARAPPGDDLQFDLEGDIPEDDPVADALEAFGAPEIPSALRIDDDDALDNFDPFANDDAPSAPSAAPASTPAPPPVPLDADVPEQTYTERLLAQVSTLAANLEGEGRFDDAAVLYEVQELLNSD